MRAAAETLLRPWVVEAATEIRPHLRALSATEAQNAIEKVFRRRRHGA